MNRRWIVLVLSSACATLAGLALGWHRLQAAPPAPVAPAALPPAQPTRAAAAGPSAIHDLTSQDDLTRLAQEHPQGLLLDFHAQWCVTCQELAPRLEHLAQQYPQLAIGAIDAAAYPKLADAYSVDTLPALVHLVQGREVARQVGAPSEPELCAWLGLKPAAGTPSAAPAPAPGGRGR